MPLFLVLSLKKKNPPDNNSSNSSSRSSGDGGQVPTDDFLNRSEHRIIVCLSISRLPQVFLNFQWFTHYENCPRIGWFLSYLKFSNQFWHGESMLGVPLAAGLDDGVPADHKWNTIIHKPTDICLTCLLSYESNEEFAATINLALEIIAVSSWHWESSTDLNCNTCYTTSVSGKASDLKCQKENCFLTYSVFEQLGGLFRCFPLCRYCRSSVAMSWANGGSPGCKRVFFCSI